MLDLNVTAKRSFEFTRKDTSDKMKKIAVITVKVSRLPKAIKTLENLEVAENEVGIIDRVVFST